ncbi:MAG TPA: hypothetical protein VFX43_01560 [Chitinophagaceae bacterium]|nr:hypothetical protein [Chitinophagaceae bacterium]
MRNSIHFFVQISLLTLVVSSACLQTASAQQDSSLQQQTIDIYNIYQPTLRAAAKLNLTATLPRRDTTRPRMVYSVPSQNLNFTYRPVPLRPLAMGRDTSYADMYNNFIKAGFGNYNTPFIQVGLSNGRNLPFQYGLDFHHISSKGDIDNQNYSKDHVAVHGQYFGGTHEFHGQVSYDRHGIRYYGYDHDTTRLGKDQVKQAYNTITANIGLSNTTENSLKLNYQPDLKLTSFSDIHGRKESTFRLFVPAQKELFKDISIVADFVGDFSTYRDDSQEYNNNLMAIHPAVEISKPHFMLHAGINPTWTNNKFYLLPDIVNETDLIKDKLILSSGWVSYFHKNSYQALAEKNPFLGNYTAPLNTRIEEKYTGIKGTINSHFTYNTKFAFVEYWNHPLFVNDLLYGNTFNTVNEEDLKAYQLHAEIGYINEERFQIKLTGDWFNYFKETTEKEPWGLRPFTAELSGQYIFAEKFRLTADLYALSGSHYPDALGNAHKTKGAFDLNAGASYQINNQFSVWLNGNNLFNSHYERWHNYPSLGLNVLGGIMIKF